MWLVFITALSWICYLFRAVLIWFYRSYFLGLLVFLLWQVTLLRGTSHHRTPRALLASTHFPCEDRIGNSVVRGLCADELTETTDNSEVSKTKKQLTEWPRGKKKVWTSRLRGNKMSTWVASSETHVFVLYRTVQAWISTYLLTYLPSFTG